MVKFCAVVLALLAMPFFAATALVALIGGFFMSAYGIFGAGGGFVVICALVVLAGASMLMRLCVWIWQGRKLLTRYQRITLGLGNVLVIGPVASIMCSLARSGIPGIYIPVLLAYVFLGGWLAMDGSKDRWSV
jgi:hypothetical protein